MYLNIGLKVNRGRTKKSRELDTKQKEIVLVIRTSTSMEKNLAGNTLLSGEKSRKEMTREYAGAFLDKLANKTNIKVSLVSFSEKATVRSELSNDIVGIKGILLGLPTIAGNNLGDGLRRAHFILAGGSAEADKYVIALTTDSPTHYTKASQYSTSYLLTDVQATYTAADATKGPGYCDAVVDSLFSTQSLKNTFVGVNSAGVAMLEALATRANGHYAYTPDEQSFETIFNTLYDDIVYIK